MAASEKALTYEEERQRIIDDNERRMKELGLFETTKSFQKPPTPRKCTRRAPSGDRSMETRRSSRAAGRAKVNYSERGVEIKIGRSRPIARPSKSRGYISPAAKNEAAVRAGATKTTHPSFVKAMLKSHTSGGFWLGLPSEFCTNNFTKDDVITLEDEDGAKWECVYLHHKHGLSGGWRGFSIDHELEDGDAVVFELVTPTDFKVYITRAAVSEEPSTKKTTPVVKKREYQYVITGSKNVHVHSALHKSLKMEKGDQFDAIVCKRSKSAKPVKRNGRSRYDCSSDESQESEDIVEETSEDESEAISETIEDSDEEDAEQSSEEDAVESSEEDGEQSSDNEVLPARKLKEKVTRPAKRSVKSKHKSPVINLVADDDEPEEESDGDIEPTKSPKLLTQRAVRSNEKPKAKTEPRQRPIAPGRKDSSRASVKGGKREAFVRRADRKTDILEVRKEIAARQIEQKRNLPPGAQLKPVGYCSITRGSAKRKLPAIFRARKYSFVSGPKSVKVQ